MPNENADNAGADDSADKVGENGNAADPNADEAKDSGAAGSGDDEKKFSQAELNEIVERRLNRAKKEAADNAKLTKEQLLEKERDDLKKEVLQRDLKESFIIAAGIEPAKATRLFKLFGDDIETDDKGKPVNLRSVISDAKKEFPELFEARKSNGAGSGDGGAGLGESTPGGGFNAALRRATGRGR